MAPTFAIPLRRTDLLALLLAAASIFLSGCPSAPTKSEAELQGLPSAEMNTPQNLSGTLFVERENKGYKLKNDINIIGADAVRMDVTTSLDLPVAAILLTNEKIQYVLYREKRFYSGKPNPHALDPVFPLTIDADTLVKILREEKPPGDKCEVENGYLSRCEGRAGSLDYNVAWSNRKGAGPLAGRASKMVLNLPSEKISLRFYFSDWQKNVSNAQRFLSLEVPPGFKTISVPEH